MRIALCIIAAGIILLGFFLITKSFEEPALAPATSNQTISSARKDGGPLGMGLALLTGGVFLFVMVCRKR